MKIAVYVIAAVAALNLAACAGPNSSGYSNYGPTSYDNAVPLSPAPSRQTRLTPPTTNLTLDTLPGMSGRDLTTQLGAPQFRRQDGQAEIWQYRTSACTLDVFLYSEGSDLRVRYVEARNHMATAGAQGDSSQARACVNALIQSRAGSAGPG